MMQNYGEEPQAKLKEAVEIVKRLDARFASFIGGECDDDILNSFHLDVFTFGLFALDEGFPLGSGIRSNELQLLATIVGEPYGEGVYEQIVDVLGPARWSLYQEEIPFTFAALIAYSSQDEVEKNCADYIELFTILAFSLCVVLGCDPAGVMAKIRMLVLYRDHEFAQRGLSGAALRETTALGDINLGEPSSCYDDDIPF